MNVPQKVLLSLFIAVILFAAFTVLAFTGLFDLVEARFYSPQVLQSLNREIEEDAQSINALITGLQDRFAATLQEGAVRRSFLPTQEGADIFERTRTYGVLMSSLPGLQTVRFVDAGGSRIHFSTQADDILRQDSTFLSYRNYRDCPDVLPYNQVEAGEDGAPRLIFDGSGERLIFSYPFADSLDVYRGSALFTFSVRGVAAHLIREGRIKVGEDVSIVSSPGGFLIGLPNGGRENLKAEVSAVWGEGFFTLSNLGGGGDEALTLISAKTGVPEILAGFLVQESMFVFPLAMKFILMGSFLLTVFLAVFLIFNLRQDNLTVIQNRLKLLQTALIRQFYEHKGEMDWKHWSRELEQRRGEIREEMKRGLPRSAANVQADTLIDRSWDELITTIGGQSSAKLDEETPTVMAAPVETTPTAEEPEVLEELEELEMLEPAEGPVERQEEVEELEPVEELEELEEVEELEELTAIEDEKLPPEKPEGGTVVTAEAFEAPNGDEPEAELEPLEELSDPAEPSNPPAAHLSSEDIARIASEIEFGTGDSAPDGGAAGEKPEGAATELDLSSPFSSLSFEAPSFSANKDGEAAADEESKKKQLIEAAQKESGLVEITKEGGLPFIYQPFRFPGNEKPLTLRAEVDPNGPPIQEQNGVHQINSEILDPDQESTRRLDQKFLNLVESIINKEE